MTSPNESMKSARARRRLVLEEVTGLEIVEGRDLGLIAFSILKEALRTKLHGGKGSVTS
jgi:hypothetical protein